MLPKERKVLPWMRPLPPQTSRSLTGGDFEVKGRRKTASPTEDATELESLSGKWRRKNTQLTSVHFLAISDTVYS
jgi:hypothetical protein